MRRLLVLASLSAAFAAAIPVRSAAAQGRDNTIDPGMTKAQVVEHLGSPQSVKTTDTLTFMYYQNGCAKTCGMQDLVILAHDKVIDAIFRDPARRYTGESSSPSQLTPAQARKEGASRKTGKTDSTTGSAPMVLPAIRQPPPTALPPAVTPIPAAPDTTLKPADSMPPRKPPAA